MRSPSVGWRGLQTLLVLSIAELAVCDHQDMAVGIRHPELPSGCPERLLDRTRVHAGGEQRVPESPDPGPDGLAGALGRVRPALLEPELPVELHRAHDASDVDQRDEGVELHPTGSWRRSWAMRALTSLFTIVAAGTCGRGRRMVPLEVSYPSRAAPWARMMDAPMG